jgi:hypothetical protein
MPSFVIYRDDMMALNGRSECGVILQSGKNRRIESSGHFAEYIITFILFRFLSKPDIKIMALHFQLTRRKVMAGSAFAAVAAGIIGWSGAGEWLTAGFASAPAVNPADLSSPGMAAHVPAKAIATAAGVAEEKARRLELSSRCIAALDLTDPTLRMAALDALLNSTHDLPGLTGIVSGFRSATKTGKSFAAEWDKFWRTLARRDPRIATALLDSAGKQMGYRDIAAKIAEEWGAADPKSAAEWLQQNPLLDAASLDRTLASLLSGHARTSLAGATEWALSVVTPAEPAFREMADVLGAAALAQGGTQGLAGWFSQLPTDGHRRAAFASVTLQMKKAGAGPYEEWLAANAASPYRNDNAYREFVEDMAVKNPEEAMAYAVNLPLSPADGKPTGVGDAAKQWFRQDMPALAAYFNSLPEGPVKSTIRWHVQRLLNSPIPSQTKDQARQIFDLNIRP